MQPKWCAGSFRVYCVVSEVLRCAKCKLRACGSSSMADSAVAAGVEAQQEPSPHSSKASSFCAEDEDEDVVLPPAALYEVPDTAATLAEMDAALADLHSFRREAATRAGEAAASHELEQAGPPGERAAGADAAEQETDPLLLRARQATNEAAANAVRLSHATADMQRGERRTAARAAGSATQVQAALAAARAAPATPGASDKLRARVFESRVREELDSAAVGSGSMPARALDGPGEVAAEEEDAWRAEMDTLLRAAVDSDIAHEDMMAALAAVDDVLRPK